MSTYLFMYLSIYLSIYLLMCLCVYRNMYTYICSFWKNMQMSLRDIQPTFGYRGSQDVLAFPRLKPSSDVASW